MAKRFTDTDKWDDDWFLSLPPRLKCVWEYLRDTCDGAGIKKVSFKKLSDLVGEPITREEFESYFSERIQWITHDVLWIHGFIRAQYKSLSINNKAHVNIAKLVLKSLEGVCLSQKAKMVSEALLSFVRASSEPQPTPTRGSSEPRPGDIGNRKQEIGEDLEGGVGETKWPRPLGGVLFELWQKHSGELPKVTSQMSSHWLEKIRARLTENPDPKYWEDLIKKMAGSSFFRGENKTKWKGTFFWLIEDGNHEKLASGSYGSGIDTNIDWSKFA